MPAALPHAAGRGGRALDARDAAPVGRPLGARGIGGSVRATFRLDSLRADGELALVSMRGEHRPPDARRTQGVATLDGQRDGRACVVDRARGWITDSRFTLLIRSRPHAAARRPGCRR